MPVNDDLGKRMKEYYEQIPKTKLMRRCPVVLRIDGRAFHTFCRSFDKPFDDILVKTMQDTMKYLCENIEGCALGYAQSDEISLLLIDYKKLDTAAWFDYEVQKLCSISASMATLAFNKFFYDNVEFSFQEEYAKINEKITNKEINSEEAEPMFDKLEDELDKYFEIVKLEELNNNDLNDTIEDLKVRLKECEEIVAKRKKEQNKVRLGDLEVGDIFTVENYIAEYRVIDHLSSCTLIANTSFSRDKDVMLPYILDSNTLVKKVDDQD